MHLKPFLIFLRNGFYVNNSVCGINLKDLSNGHLVSYIFEKPVKFWLCLFVYLCIVKKRL